MSGSSRSSLLPIEDPIEWREIDDEEDEDTYDFKKDAEGKGMSGSSPRSSLPVEDPTELEEKHGKEHEETKDAADAEAEWERATKERQKDYKIVPEFWAGHEVTPDVDNDPADSCHYPRSEFGLQDEAQGGAKGSFDNGRFLKYQELKHKLFAARRMDRFRAGLPMPTYTDEDILKEMTEFYGEMDQSSEKFKRMFEGYKKSFLEQVAECEKEEESVKQECERSGKSLIDPFLNAAGKVEENIRVMFTPEERELYGSLDPKKSTSGADWVDVPRPGEKLRREGTSRLLEMDDEAAEQAKPNLAELDPKYCDFPKWTSSSEHVGLALCRSIDKVLHEFPGGLTVEAFLQRFEEKHGYLIDFKSMGFHHPAEFFEEMNHINIMYSATERKNSKAYIFPASFEDHLLPLRTVMKRMRHVILKELSYNYGIIDLSTLDFLLRADQKLSINFSDWGFPTAAQFVQGIFKGWEQPWCIEHVYIKFENGVESPKEYLISDTAQMHYLIQKLREMDKDYKKIDEGVPSGSSGMSNQAEKQKKAQDGDERMGEGVPSGSSGMSNQAEEPKKTQDGDKKVVEEVKRRGPTCKGKCKHHIPQSQ